MIEQTVINRQNVLSRDEHEVELRTQDTVNLIHDIIGRHQEYFADSQNRLDFIKDQTPEDFLNIVKYINAKLRGQIPHQLKNDEDEKGGFLPMLHTPSHKNKPRAFKGGYEAIQEYIETSSDSIDKKIEGVAMATEALIIWVHPFNDGNGRTSRFLGKLIEDGATDVDELVAHTALKGGRNRYYSDKYTTREEAISKANNEDIMFEDEEREELREKAKKMPPDVIGVKLSIKNLLENDDVRRRTLRYAKLEENSLNDVA